MPTKRGMLTKLTQIKISLQSGEFLRTVRDDAGGVVQRRVGRDLSAKRNAADDDEEQCQRPSDDGGTNATDAGAFRTCPLPFEVETT